jgi:hypothetical protein
MIGKFLGEFQTRLLSETLLLKHQPPLLSERTLTGWDCEISGERKPTKQLKGWKTSRHIMDWIGAGAFPSAFKVNNGMWRVVINFK